MKKNKSNDPTPQYTNLTISSFEQLSEMDREHTRNMTPEQRMEYLQQLNKNVYGHDLSAQREESKKGRLTIRKEE